MGSLVKSYQFLTILDGRTVKNPFNSMSDKQYVELEPGSPQKKTGSRLFPCGCKLTFEFLINDDGRRFNEATNKQYCYWHKREKLKSRIEVLQKKLRDEKRKLADLDAVQKISAIIHGQVEPIGDQ